ncbi:MAG: hypothetical protein F6K35_38330, partial [Okeania sp. SIO2H7]|nr:hypothetical protein [Okeania sp. SIO2H7]
PRPRPRDVWEESKDEEEKYSGSSRSRGDVSATTYPETRPSRRRRPSVETSDRGNDADVAATSTDYVEYRPVESPEEEFDNSSNFDS